MDKVIMTGKTIQTTEARMTLERKDGNENNRVLKHIDSLLIKKHTKYENTTSTFLFY